MKSWRSREDFAGAVAGRWCFDWLSHMDVTPAMPRFEVPVEYR